MQSSQFEKITTFSDVPDAMDTLRDLATHTDADGKPTSEALEAKGLVVSGVNPERDLVEIIELKNHPFFLGTQFHPEFKSRPLRPHPLFKEFIRAAAK